MSVKACIIGGLLAYTAEAVIILVTMIDVAWAHSRK